MGRQMMPELRRTFAIFDFFNAAHSANSQYVCIQCTHVERWLHCQAFWYEGVAISNFSLVTAFMSFCQLQENFLPLKIGFHYLLIIVVMNCLETIGHRPASGLYPRGQRLLNLTNNKKQNNTLKGLFLYYLILNRRGLPIYYKITHWQTLNAFIFLVWCYIFAFCNKIFKWPLQKDHNNSL